MSIVDWIVRVDDAGLADVWPAVVQELKARRHRIRLADDEKPGADLVRWAVAGAPKTGQKPDAPTSQNGLKRP